MAIPKNNKLKREPPALPSLEEEVEDFTTVTEDDFIEEQEDTEYLEEVESSYSEDEIELPKYPDNEPLIEKEEKTEYINKEKKKIVPLGAKASKIKASDFDSRHNLLVSLKIFRVFVYIVILGLFIIGLKNTFFPPNTYTTKDIASIATQVMGKTSFPLERGKGFSEEFMTYYLNSDVTDITSKKILTRFYKGFLDENVTTNYMTKKSRGDTRQKALTDPICIEAYSPFDYLGVYKYTVLVSDSTGELTSSDNSLKGHWLTFSLNVYYDKQTDSLSLHQDSPTLVPNYGIEDNSKLPFEAPIGNGEINNDMLSTLTPIINNYIVAYSRVDVRNYDEIKQYIPNEAGPDLYSGFGGNIAIEKDVNTSIQKVVYNSTTLNEYKVDVKVDWKDLRVSGSSAIFTSRYILTIQKQGDRYIVTKFAPYLYVKQ